MAKSQPDRLACDIREATATVRAEIDRLRAENEALRKAFCDEAYILMVQALDVKSLPKGRKRILTEQAIRMARVGLNEGHPRHTTYLPSTLYDRARDVIAALASDEARLPESRCPKCGWMVDTPAHELGCAAAPRETLLPKEDT